jgi:hypothetical protein
MSRGAAKLDYIDALRGMATLAVILVPAVTDDRSASFALRWIRIWTS